MPIGANTTPRNMLYNLNLKGFVSDWNSTDNFSVESSDQSVVTTEIIAEETFMRAVNSGQSTLRFSNESGDSFTLTAIVKKGIQDDLDLVLSSPVYVGEVIEIPITTSEIPLSSYTIEKANDTGDYNLTITESSIIIEGIKAGRGRFYYDTEHFGRTEIFTILDKPSVNNIGIANNVIIPINMWIYLYNLIDAGYISGIDATSFRDYSLSSTSNIISIPQGDDHWDVFKATASGNATITFTHKKFNECHFDVNLLAKKGANEYVEKEIGTLYINEPREFIVPDEYLPLSFYSEIISGQYEDYLGTAIKTEIKGDTLILTGASEGECYLRFDSNFGSSTINGITIAKKPSKEDIVVNDSSIVVPSNSWIYLNQLIEDKVVEGVFGRGDNYAITSTNSDVRCDDDGSFIFWSAGSSKITFTHKEFPDVTFDLDVTAKLHPFNYIEQNLGTVYVGSSKDITIPDEYLPLDDFLDIKKADRPLDEGSTADFEFSHSGNNLTIRGISEGRRLLEFHHKFGTNLAATITIAKKPSKEDIHVHEESITVPTGSDIRLSTLIESGVVSGVNISDSDWLISSTNPDFYIDNDYNYAITSYPGTSTITFTNKDFKDVSFSIEVTAKFSPTAFIQENLGTVYINDSREITIPDEYIPLSDFTTIQRADWTWENHPNADFKVEHEGNTLFITGLGEGERMLEFIHKYGSNIGAIITIAKKPSKEDIVVNDSIIIVPTVTSIHLSKLIDSGMVSGASGSNKDWIITSSNSNLYVNNSDNYFSFNDPDTSTITYTNKDFKEVSFSIEVAAHMHIAKYLDQHLGTVYINESKSITIPDDIIPLDAYTEIVKADYTWPDYPDADFEVKRDGNKLTITGLGEGVRELRFNHKVAGWSSLRITIAKKPSADNIKTPGSGVVIPTRTVLNLQNMITDGWVTGIIANQANDFTLTSSDNEIFWPYNNSSNGYARGNKTGEVTLTFTHKELPDVKFDFVVNVKKGPAESIINQMGNPYVGTPYTITLDSEIPLSDYQFKLLNDNGEEDPDLVLTLDGNNLTILGNAPMECILWYTYLPTNSRSGHGFSIVEAPANTPVVDEDGNGQSQTSIETPVKITLPAEIAEKAEGKTVIWKSDNEGVATVDENGLVHPVKVGKTVITASVEDVSSRAGATTLMSIDFWVTDIEISVPSTLKVGETAKANYRVVPEDCPNKPDNLWWRPYNTAVVAIDSDGNIKAVGPGSTEVALIAGSRKKFAIITVVGDDEPEVTEINLDTEKISGVEGTTYHLQADVDDLTWSSSDESVAVVDQNGIVTLVGAGRAIITATAPNGVKATCEVVVEAASGINGVEADTEAAFAPVYDLTGRLVARTSEQMATLRAGIYIQAGRKIYISK